MSAEADGNRMSDGLVVELGDRHEAGRLLAGARRRHCKITSMTLKETLTQLEAVGNEKMRAQDTKNGAGDNQFGVRLGDIRVLAKKIKKNHELAMALWDTGNIDARLLATLVVKPKSLSSSEMDRMVRTVDPDQGTSRVLPRTSTWYKSTRPIGDTHFLARPPSTGSMVPVPRNS